MFQYYEEMLQLPELDVVSIAAPDHWHTRMTIDSCKAGKDVFCEKPLTFTLMESRQIVAAARKYNRVVSSGSQRVMEDYGHILAPIVMSGAIGEVKEIYAGCAGPPSERTYDPEPCPPELDWDCWVGQAPWFPYSKRAIQPMTWRFNSDFVPADSVTGAGTISAVRSIPVGWTISPRRRSTPESETIHIRAFESK